ncbi:hypothetical protein [Thermogemmatispora sp.]|nr:hypothetical protein [Thermogemmatispora sp.]
MEILLAVIDWIGRILTILALIAFVLSIYEWSRGVLKVLYRLGHGLARPKIAILGDKGNTIKSTLETSRLFNERRLILISSVDDLGRAESASLWLFHWWGEDPWGEKALERVLNFKKDSTALIVYAPHQEDRKSIPRLSDQMMEELSRHRHTIVNNFRGRLLNDVIVSLMAISDQSHGR